MVGVKGKSGDKPWTPERFAAAQRTIGVSLPVDYPVPESLRAHGKSAWGQIWPVICERCAEKDVRIVEAYCLAWQTYFEASDARNAEMYLYTEKGMTKHPLLAVETEMLDKILSYSKHLHLFPASTGNLAPTQAQDGKATAESILKMRRG